MKLYTALKLGRVSNLPTVTSNVLAAIALAGATPSLVTIVLACVAMSAMYVAGMFLNDAFDRDYDREHRPDRPIPAGEVHASLVFDVGFGLLIFGIVAVTVAAIGAGAGWKPVMSSLALASLIIFYDANHKQNAAAPLVMGLCRAAVYTTAALLVRADLCFAVLAGCALLVSYLIGLTYVARQENLDRVSNLWPLAFLAAPFVFVLPHGWLELAIYVVFLQWVIRAVGLVVTRKIKNAVISLIAGISLLDALACAHLGRNALAIAAAAAFVLTNMLQRLVPGT